MSLPQELDRKFLRFALTHFGGLVRSVSRYPKHWLLCAVFLMFLFADIMDLMFRARITNKSAGSLIFSGWLLHGIEASSGLLSGVCVLGIVTHLVCITHEFHELGKAPQLKDKALFAANAMSLGYLWALAWLYSVAFAVHQLTPDETTQEIAIGPWLFVLVVTVTSQVAFYKYGLKQYLIESRLFPLQQKKIDEKGDDVYIRARLSMLQEMSTYLEKDPIRPETPARDAVEESLRIEVRNLNTELNLARETSKAVVVEAPPRPDIEAALQDRQLLEQQLDAVRLENRGLREQLQEAGQKLEAAEHMQAQKVKEPDFLEELKEQQKLCDEARQSFDQKQAELATQLQAHEQLSEHASVMAGKILELQNQLQEAKSQFAQISKHTETLAEANQRLKDDAEKTNQRYDTLVEAVKTRMGEWKEKQLATKENERLSSTLAGTEAKYSALLAANEGLSLQLQQLKVSDAALRAELLDVGKKATAFETDKNQLTVQLLSTTQANTALTEEVERLKQKMAAQQTLMSSHETSIKEHYIPKTELISLSHQLEKFQSAHTTSISELKTVREELDKANTTAQQQNLYVKDLEAKLETAEVSVDRLEAQVTTQQRFLDNVGVTELTLQTLRAQLKAEQDRANTLSEEIQSRDKEMAQEMQKRKRVESKMLALEKTTEAAKGSTNEIQMTHQAELGALQATNSQLTTVLREKEAEIERLQTELTAIQASSGRLSSELESSTQERQLETERLRQELLDTTQEKEKSISELKEQIAGLTTELAKNTKEYQSCIQQLQQELANTQTNQTTQTTEVSELETLRQEYAKLEASYQTQTSEHGEKIQALKQTIIDLQEKLAPMDDLQQEITALTATNAALLADFAALRQTPPTDNGHDSTDDKLLLLQNEILSLQAVNLRLSTQANNAKENEIKLQSLQQELSGLQSTNARLAEEVRSHERTAERMQTIHENLTQDVATLQTNNTKLQAELSQCSSELLEAQQESSGSNSDDSEKLAFQLSQTQEQLMSLQEKLENLEAQVRLQTEKDATSQQELAVLKSTNVQISERIFELENLLAIETNLTKQLTNEITVLQDANAQLNAQMSEERAKIAMEAVISQEATKALEADITTREEKVRELQARVQTMEAADEAKKQKFQTAVAMAKKAQMRVALLEAELKKSGLAVP